MDGITESVIGSLFHRMTPDERQEWLKRYMQDDVKEQLLKIGDKETYAHISELLTRQIEIDRALQTSSGS